MLEIWVKHFIFYNLLRINITFTYQPLPTLTQARQVEHPPAAQPTKPPTLLRDGSNYMHVRLLMTFRSNCIAVLLFDANLGFFLFLFFFLSPVDLGLFLHKSPLVGPVTQKFYRSLPVSLQILGFFFFLVCLQICVYGFLQIFFFLKQTLVNEFSNMQPNTVK